MFAQEIFFSRILGATSPTCPTVSYAYARTIVQVSLTTNQLMVDRLSSHYSLLKNTGWPS